jgi:hypothetical protein
MKEGEMGGRGEEEQRRKGEKEKWRRRAWVIREIERGKNKKMLS